MNNIMLIIYNEMLYFRFVVVCVCVCVRVFNVR